MKLGRHRGKRSAAWPDTGARHRTAPAQSRRHSDEMAGSGGPRRRPDPVRRRPAGWFGPRCRWAAKRLRTITGLTGFDLEREYLSDRRLPWVGLLLWALAGAGLFVSLLMQPNELVREPRLAAREAIEAQPSTGASSMLGQVGKSRL
jgi:hypothetical protein